MYFTCSLNAPYETVLYGVKQLVRLAQFLLRMAAAVKGLQALPCFAA